MSSVGIPWCHGTFVVSLGSHGAAMGHSWDSNGTPMGRGLSCEFYGDFVVLPRNFRGTFNKAIAIDGQMDLAKKASSMHHPHT